MKGSLLFYLGIDYIKSTFIDDDGKEQINIEKPLNLYLNEEYVEQDPEEWFGLITQTIKEIQDQYNDITVNSISVTYQPGTFVCIDRSGNNLLNAILPCDKRAKYLIQTCSKSLNKYLAGCNIPWDSMILPKLLWIKYNKPDIYKKVFKVLTPDGYIAYKLCGETGIDNYSAAFLGYNPKNCCFSSRLLEILEIETDTLPEVRKIGECIGFISGLTKEKLNLKSDVKYIMASNSIIPKFLMLDNQRPDAAIYDIDSSSIYFSNSSINHSKSSGIIKCTFKDSKSIHCYLGNYEFSFLKRMKRYIDIDNINYDDYIIGSNGLIVLPYLMGQNTFANSDLRAGIIGINNTTISNIVTAFYESIGYIIKEKIDSICDKGFHIDSLNIIGPKQTDIFYQIISNILSKKVIINANYNDYAKNIWSLINNINGYDDNYVEKEITPDEKLYSKYTQLFSLYKNARNSLSDICEYRRKVLKKVMV